MKALILVAGRSRRMGELTYSVPKTLLQVGGRPILQWMLDALDHEGIRDVIFVCGYLKEQLQAFMEQNFPRFQVTWVENELYTETNTAYSVWLTREVVLSSGEEILLINGDVVLDYRAIAATMAVRSGNVLATRLDRVDKEEVKVRLDKNMKVLEIGKHIEPSRAAGESVGINKLSRSMLSTLYSVLKQRITEGDGAREFYEAAFDELIHLGHRYDIADVTELPVMEIDTVDDYEEVQRSIVSRLLR